MQNFTAFDLIVVIVYLLVMAGLGIAQTAKVKTSGDYFAGGRKFSKFLMVMHALGTGTHADDPVGVAGAAYQQGISGIWYTYIYLFLTPVYWIIAPLYRRSRYITTADFFEKRYSSSMALLYTIVGILTFSVNTGIMLKATGTIATTVTGGALSPWVAVLGMTAVFMIYGFAGGLIATVVTESVQGVLIVVMSLLIVPYGLWQLGGVGQLHALLGPAKFSLAAPGDIQELGIPWIIAGVIMAMLSIVAQPHVMEVCSTGKTEFEGRVGFTYGNFVKRFCAMGWVFTGLIVAAMVAQGTIGVGDMARAVSGAPAAPDAAWIAKHAREGAFGVAIRQLLPPGATGLMFAAILAAQMSTLSAFMVAGSALITRNVIARYWAKEADDKQLLRYGRFTGFIVVVLGLCFSSLFKSVAEGLTVFLGIAALMGVFCWAGLIWKRTNAAGAWLSFIVMAVIWTTMGPFGKYAADALDKAGYAVPYFLGMYGDKAQIANLLVAWLPAGLVVLVLGSLLTKQRNREEVERFFKLIKVPVGREEELDAQGIEVVYKGETKGHPWELNHPKATHWGGFAIALVFSFVILGLLWLLARWGA